MENRIDEIRNLIGDVEFLAAINEVIELTTSLGHKDLRDDAFLLKSNQVQLNQDRNKGLGSSDEFAGRQNIIVDKVLDLLSDLEIRVTTKPEPPKKEPIVESIVPPKTITKTIAVTTSNNNLPKVIVAVVAGLLILFFGYRFMKSSSKKTEKETVAKVDTCEEALNRIEEAIAAKEFLIARKGLFKADKICTEKIRLTLLFEDYNDALEAAKESGEPIKVTEETPNKPTETEEETKPNDNGTKPDDGIKPGIVKPGLITIDPSRLTIKPGILNLDTWTGTWSSDFGEIAFIQKDSQIMGDYPKANGWLNGTYNKRSKKWTGTFYNGISKKYGKFEFVKNGKEFSGIWYFDDNSLKGTWKGKQTSTVLPTLKIFPKEKRN